MKKIIVFTFWIIVQSSLAQAVDWNALRGKIDQGTPDDIGAVLKTLSQQPDCYEKQAITAWGLDKLGKFSQSAQTYERALAYANTDPFICVRAGINQLKAASALESGKLDGSEMIQKSLHNIILGISLSPNNEPLLRMAVEEIWANIPLQQAHLPVISTCLFPLLKLGLKVGHNSADQTIRSWWMSQAQDVLLGQSYRSLEASYYFSEARKIKEQNPPLGITLYAKAAALCPTDLSASHCHIAATRFAFSRDSLEVALKHARYAVELAPQKYSNEMFTVIARLASLEKEKPNPDHKKIIQFFQEATSLNYLSEIHRATAWQGISESAYALNLHDLALQAAQYAYEIAHHKSQAICNWAISIQKTSADHIHVMQLYKQQCVEHHKLSERKSEK